MSLSFHRIASRLSLLLILACSVLVFAHTTQCHSAEGATQTVHDEVWVISTRNVHCRSDELRPDKLRVSRLDGTQWAAASYSEYAECGKDRQTVVYVHGNRMDARNASNRGLLLYRHILCGDEGRPPIRFVIWSWPSNRLTGLIRDVRQKALRTNIERDYLARFLSQSHGRAPITLVGYSFGARVVTGALQSLAQTVEDVPPIRAALLAAAVDRDWLSQCGHHGLAMRRADSVMLMYNRLDPVLKRYRFLEPNGDPQALGFSGFPRDVAHSAPVEQIDVSGIVGRSHFEMRYYGSHTIRHRLRPFLLWEPGEVSAEP